jgi:hypothetical protein
VKEVHHILPELNTLIQKHKISVYLLGPILNKSYYEVVKEQLGGVEYLGCLPYQSYLNLLRKALVMINTSASEGMSCSIL